MLRILLSSFLASSLLSAVTIDELVKNSFEKNYDLKSLNKSIQVANEQIKVSKNWENPMLEFSANNIGLNKPLSNQKEYGVEISQVIPLGNRLDIEESIAKKDKNIKEFDLEDKKLELESKIYEYSYNILISERRYKLIENYIKNIEKLQELYSSLYKYEKASQNDILNSQISSMQIELEKQNLKNTIDNLYLQLEQVTYTKIDKIQESININKIDLLVINQDHPKFKTLEESANKSKNLAELESAKKTPDVEVSLGYFQKEDDSNYVNLSLSFPLPIYKTEDASRLQARMNTNETNDKLEQLKHNFKIQSEILKNTLNTSYNNYNLIKEKIIPIQEKIQKNLETYNSFDKVNPQESISNLNELILYETKSLDELQKYYEAYSQLIYFTNKGIK